MNIRNLFGFIFSILLLSGCTIEAELLRFADESLPSLTPPDTGGPGKPTTASFNVRSDYPETSGTARNLHATSDGQLIFTGTISNNYFANSYFKKISPVGAPVALSAGTSQSVTSYFSLVHSALNSTRDHLVQLGYYYEISGGSIALVKTDTNGVADSSFNNGARVSLNLDPSKYFVQWVGVDSSDRIYIVGVINDGPIRDLIAVRYLANGSIDTGFGAGGIVQTDINSTIETLEDCTLQSDQKLVCAGAAGNHFFVIRYDTSGTLDSTFSGDGILTDYFQPTAFDMDRIYAVTTKPGKILALGRGTVAGRRIIALNDDGSRDNSFATNGLYNVGNEFSYTDHIAVTASGDLLIAGSKVNGANTELRVARILANGSADATFGTAGVVALNDFHITNTAIWAVASSLTLDAAGGIYLYGTSFSADTNSGFYAIKLQANGSLDNTFGTAGVIRPHFLISSDEEIKQSLRQGEDILISGIMLKGRAAFLTKEKNSVLDTTFGSQGHFTFYTDNYERIESVNISALPAGGYYMSLLIGNQATQLSTQKILKITSAGILDMTFNGTGIVNMPNPEAMSLGILAIDQNNNLFVLNQLWDGPDLEKMIISKFNQTGALDATFGSGGQLVTALEVWPLSAEFLNGRLVVGANSYDDAYVLRFMPDGSLDLTFNSVGFTTYAINTQNERMSLHFDNQQNIALFYSSYDSAEKFILKMDQDGILDATWGTGGALAIPTGPLNILAAIDRDSQGNWLLAGTESYEKAVVVRLTAGGAIDTTFADNGYLVDSDYLYFKTVQCVENDDIITTGEISTDGIIDAALVRYTKEGVR